MQDFLVGILYNPQYPVKFYFPCGCSLSQEGYDLTWFNHDTLHLGGEVGTWGLGLAFGFLLSSSGL